MQPTAWTRGALIALVGGTRLLMRGADAVNLEPPAWLAEVVEEITTLDSVESVEMTHPDDRNALIEAFVHAREHPGVLSPCHIRMDFFGMWIHLDVVWLNLLDHPDVGGIICTSTIVDGPSQVVEESPDTGTTNATNWMILVLDPAGRIDSVRGRVDDILGYPAAEVVGHLPTDFIHPDHASGAIDNWMQLALDPSRTRAARWRWCRKDGSEVWLESSYLVHDDGLVEVIVVDVSEQVANEEALAASQREVTALAEDFRLLADEVPTAVFRCDAAGHVQFHNAQWSEMFHLDGPVTMVHDLVHPDRRADVEALLREIGSDESSGAGSLEVPAAGGGRVLEIRCRVVTGSGGDRFVGSVADVTAAATFRHQALHDPLTGLANRSFIESRLSEAIRSDPDGTLVVFVDLDGFKAVNDNYGHDAGDAVLVEVGHRLSRAVRPGDAVARYGGDEFVIVCHGVSGVGAEHITHRLNTVFDDPIDLDGWSWQPAASIGAARPEPDVDAGTVLRRADHAMFEVKRSRKRGG
jgi:diguanylate cyclase (GGDEF)-like protein/PAS domain S-box-containing protein